MRITEIRECYQEWVQSPSGEAEEDGMIGVRVLYMSFAFCSLFVLHWHVWILWSSSQASCT